MPDERSRARLAIILIGVVFIAGIALGYLLAQLS
jgi:uncharacterized protein YneF (UPF0154 family)